MSRSSRWGALVVHFHLLKSLNILNHQRSVWFRLYICTLPQCITQATASLGSNGRQVGSVPLVWAMGSLAQYTPVQGSFYVLFAFKLCSVLLGNVLLVHDVWSNQELLTWPAKAIYTYIYLVIFQGKWDNRGTVHLWGARRAEKKGVILYLTKSLTSSALKVCLKILVTSIH